MPPRRNRHRNQHAAAKAERQQQVAALYLEGYRQTQIAEQLGVNQSVVSRDLAAVKDRWLESALFDFDAIRARELARIDRIEIAAWEGWRRSCEKAVTETIKDKPGGRETGLRRVAQAGDPRFLDQVQKCIAQRCNLLGFSPDMPNAGPAASAGQSVADVLRAMEAATLGLPSAGEDSPWPVLRRHEQQMRLWTAPQRFIAVAAGRGSGKTELAKRKLIAALPEKKEWDTPRYFFGAPTHAQAKRIAWHDLLRLLPESWVAGGKSGPNVIAGEMRITTIWGSELHVIGLDRPQRYEGLQWDGGIIDESSDQRPRMFALTVVPMLTHRNGWCWRIGVPKRSGVGAPEFRKFWETGMKGEGAETGIEAGDIASFAWPSSDILPPEQLQFAREHLDPADFREQFEASWETTGSSIFYAFSREHNVRPCGYRPELPIVVGSDFNVDPMAWAIGHNIDGRIEWFDELWLRNTNTPKALDTLYQRYATHKSGFQFYGDAAGSQRKTSATQSDYQHLQGHEGFKRLGRTIHYPKANPPIDMRFSACNAMLLNAAGQRRMFIDPRCTHLIDDLEHRHYKEGTREPNDVGDIGHLSDGMGYAVHRLYPIRTRPQSAGIITTT